MKIGELLVGIAFLTVAVTAFVIAGDYHSTANPADPGPALYPRLMATLMGLCALVVMYRALIQPRNLPVKGGEWRLALITFIIGIGYVMIFQPLGYLLSTGLVLLLMMLVGGVRRWTQLVSIPIVYVALTYYLFHDVLMLQLPMLRLP